METSADILFPLALENLLTYKIPGEFAPEVFPGKQVQAPVGQKSYTGIVWRIHKNEPLPGSEETYKEVTGVEKSLPVIPEQTLKFWEWIARYYMCPPGTVAKKALSLWKFKRRNVFSGTETFLLPKVGKPLYISGPERIGFYGKQLQNMIEAGGQCLILEPDRAACENIYEKLLPLFGQTLFCFHSKRPMKEQSRAQKELYAGNPCIVCGMHHALFLPFTRLGLILVDMEEHPGHKKQDAAPHLHSRETALMMGQMFRAQVILGSVIPSLETFYNLKKNKFQHLAEVQEKNFLRAPLIITNTVKSLISNAMKGVLDIKTVRTAREVIDNGKEVLLVESDPDYLEDAPGDSGIKVCRPYRLHHFLEEKTGMICFLHTEKLLSRKHFRATEQALHLAVHALTWASSQTPAIPVIFQTAETDHPFYQWIKEEDHYLTLSHLLEERIRYNYPPHTRMIGLTVSHARKTTAGKKASEIGEMLVKADFPARTEGPFCPVGTRKIVFAYRIQLIIPRNLNAQNVKDRLAEIIKQHSCSPAQCRIDVDPA